MQVRAQSDKIWPLGHRQAFSPGILDQAKYPAAPGALAAGNAFTLIHGWGGIARLRKGALRAGPERGARVILGAQIGTHDNHGISFRLNRGVLARTLTGRNPSAGHGPITKLDAIPPGK